MHTNRKIIIGLIAAGMLSVLGVSQLEQQCVAPQMIGRQLPHTSGYSFKIISPDTDYCILPHVILSKSNYTALQNNVGVFTVLEKKVVTTSPTMNYCQLAKWLYDAHKDTYPNIYVRFKDRMLPAYCNIELNPPQSLQLVEMLSVSDNTAQLVVIPEFPITQLLVFTVAFLSICLGWKVYRMKVS